MGQLGTKLVYLLLNTEFSFAWRSVQMFRKLAVIASLMLFASILFGQATNATLTGRVADPTKASIVGARVTITNPETNVHYTATTNGEGIYTVSTLPPGRYKVEVEKASFRSVVRPDGVLHVSDT